MKQLTGLDAAFLYMETPTNYGHVNGLGVYETAPDGFRPFDEVRARFGALVGHLPPLRRRVVSVPFGLDHPYWIDDPEFDLDYHVRQIGLPSPGDDRQLSEQIARIIGRPMDRRHPLWEVYVMEGLADGRWALLTKFHHATIDGAAGVILLQLVTSLDPDAAFPYEPVEWTPEPIPPDRELLRHAVTKLASDPIRAARLQLRLVRNLADAAGLTTVSGLATRSREVISAVAGRSERAEALTHQLRRVAMPVTPAPATPWNRAVGPHRRFAMASASLDDIKEIKNAVGGTVNDVVMAVCTGALREYLLDHGALPDAPLRAMVPVSVRTGLEDDPWTNLVSSIVAELPTDRDDPLERIAGCRAAMAEAKHQLDLVPADTLTAATDTLSPVVAGAAVRLLARLSDRMTVLPVNVVISNVPGPRRPLYFAGARLERYIPISTIANGVGLNITVHSYEDRLDFGLVADRDLVPDLQDLLDLHLREIERLRAAVASGGVSEPASRSQPVPTSKPTKVTKATKTSKRATAKRTAKASTKRAGPAAGTRSATGSSGGRKAAAKRSAAARRSTS